MPRRPLDEKIVDKMHELSSMGMYAHEIGKTLWFSTNTIQKYLYVDGVINWMKRRWEIKRSRNGT